MTPRTLEPIDDTNFMIFKKNLVLVTHCIEYHYFFSSGKLFLEILQGLKNHLYMTHIRQGILYFKIF